MTNLDATPIKAALDRFLGAPTKDHQEILNTAADAYRDAWISARALGPKPSAKSESAKTKYERDTYVSREIDGATVRLALQERTQKDGQQKWWVMSWRTTVATSGRNRRFYFMREQYWTMPADDALELMREMEAKGAFDDGYRDTRDSSDFTAIVSTELDANVRKQRLKEITHSDEDWGDDPFFVIVDDPHKDWRKVMLVNPDSGELTFRSVTRSTTYRPRKALRPSQDWQLDNTMMDANVQQMRHFLRELGSYLAE